jgi:YbbR domain-containing protein
MMVQLRAFTKTIPSLITAVLLAIAVWIMAVNSSDPSVEKAFPNPIPLEIMGQSSNMVITTELPGNVALSLRAPSSVWTTLLTEKAPVRAIIDLSGLSEGVHIVPIQIQIGLKPIEVRSYNPRSVSLELEPLATSEFEIKVINQGSLPVGYQSEVPVLSNTTATVSGARSRVARVVEIRAIINLADVTSDISKAITLQPLDSSGVLVKGVNVSPEKITYTQAIAERGGYRNVVVKVVTVGQIANGFKLANLSVFPPTVTVFSSDPVLIDNLPGYVETQPIDLTGRNETFEQTVNLRLPSGVQLIENQMVTVTVGVSPIESSLSLTDIPVEATGLTSNLKADILPLKVNLIISGPVNLLNAIKIEDLKILLDLTGFTSGKYTIEPKVSLNLPGFNIESITPTTFVITIY